jgi:hypothetical protein
MPVFAHPAAVWLAPAIALPIIFHLFFRLRRQVRDFPALLFFQRIDPRLSAKRKLHEWLILLLRCLFIALLVAALLRPLLGVHQAGGAVARLVLLDNSGSMAGPARSGLKKWDLAKNATQQLISSLHTGDTVMVMLAVPDPTAGLPTSFDAPASVVRDAVGKLVVSDGAASVPKAMRRALAALDNAKAARRELIVVTDLQRDNWTRGNFEAEPTTSHIVIRRVASEPATAGEVAFQTLELPTRAIPVGRITPLRIALQNNGTAPAKARLNSSDDSGRNQTRDLELAPNASSNSTLTFSFTTPGFHWSEWWVEGDTSPTAIRSDVGFWCTDVQKVLFAGQEGDFGALPYAVSPGGNANLTGLQSVYIDPGQIASNLAAKPLAIVSSWNQIDPALQDYARQGGTLFLVPHNLADGSATPPAWIGATLGPAHTATATDPEPILLLQDGDPVWHDLRDESGRPDLGTLRAFQYVPVRTTGDGWQPLIASGKGATLLARRTLGKGRILASGMEFTPRASSLPLKAGFVVLVQNAIFNDQAEDIPVRIIHAGDEVALPNRNVTIKSLAGSPISWQGAGREFAGFPRAGVYEIRGGDHVEWITASGDPNEAHLDFLPLGPIPLLRSLPHDIAPLEHDDDLTRIEVTPATTSSFYPWLLLAALIVILAETWLANERSSELGASLMKAISGRKTPTGQKPESKPKKTAVKVKTPKAAKAKVKAKPAVAKPVVATPKVATPKVATPKVVQAGAVKVRIKQ